MLYSTRSIHRYINTVPIGAPHPTQQDTNSTQLTSFFIHGSNDIMVLNQVLIKNDKLIKFVETIIVEHTQTPAALLPDY